MPELKTGDKVKSFRYKAKFTTAESRFFADGRNKMTYGGAY